MVFPQIEQIKDSGLKRSVSEAWAWLAKRSKWERFEDIPVWTGTPIMNAPHVRHVIDTTLHFADSVEKVHGVKLDRDLIIAAGILIDASKMIEYDPGPAGELTPSPAYGILPHAVMGAVAAIEAGVPTTVVDTILTHSPRSERKPISLEGRLIRIIDEADATAYGVL